MKPTPNIIVTAVVLALPWASASAETSSEPEESYYVETSAGSDVFDPRAPTGFVTDVDLRTLEASGEDLGDALDRIPGLFVLRRSSLGQPAYASLRGGNPRQVSVSISGIEISIPAGLGFDVGGTSALGIERARVFRGAAGVHRGAGALTGAIELVPRLRLESGNEVHLTTVAGSFGTLSTSGTVAVDSDWASVALGASRRRSDGDFTFEDGDESRRRINNDHERLAAFGTSRVEINSVDSLTMTGRFETGERGTPGPSEFQSALSEARAGDSRAVGTVRFDHRGVVSNRQVGTLDLYEAAGGQWRRETYENDQTALGSGTFRSESEYVAVVAKAGLFHWKRLPLREGANAIRLDYSFRSEEYGAIESGVFDSEIDVSRRTHSVSLSDELLFEDAYSFVAGARFESIGGERDASELLPFGGVSLRLLDWLELQSNLALTYRPPDFDELYLNSEILRGDPSLRAERSTAFDLGASASHDLGSVELVYFQNDVRDPIRFLPVNVYLTQATNLDDYTARGGEFSGLVRPLDRLAFEAAYTFTWASLEEVDAQAPFVPRHTARGSAHLELAGWVPIVDRMRASLDARYRGAMNIDLLGNRSSPGWVDLGASVLVSPLSWLALQVSGHNLLDRRDIVDVLQQPLPGRAFYVSLTVETEQP